MKFHPIEEKLYQITIPVTVKKNGISEKSLEFSIEGYGDMATKRGSSKERNIFSKVSNYTKDFPVSFSIERLDIDAMPIWNKRKEIIFIKNHSKDKIIQYIWGT